MDERKWVFVDSSNLKEVAYDSANQILYVRFRSGGTYAYDEVSIDEYRELLAAPSIGRQFIDTIKHYKPTRRLDDNA